MAVLAAMVWGLAGCGQKPHGGPCPPCPLGQECDAASGLCVDIVEPPEGCDPECENGGQCTEAFVCDCSATGGYDGPACEDFHCEGAPCLNGGTCVGPDTCLCEATGHSGPRCELPDPVEIFDPYAEVSWLSFGQHRTNLHSHTTQSDGAHTPAQMIDRYRELGYAVLALTDHAGGGHPYAVTWPWTDYGRDPAALGMVAVQGCEPSDHHHMGSYFNDYDGSAGSTEASIAAIGARGGLAVLFHPGRYSHPTSYYAGLFLDAEHLVGLEVYNANDRYPGDRALWDYLLRALMPARPVWGTANDDSHSTGAAGRNWQMLLLPELSEVAVRNAMTRGHFYFAHVPTPGGEAPLIHEIAVNRAVGTITINASGHTGLRWISGGAILAEDLPVLDVTGVQGYLRVELPGPSGSITHTQPFFIGDPEGGTPGLPLGLRVGCAGTVLPCVSPDNVVVQAFGHRPRTEDGWSTRSLVGGNATHGSAAELDASAQGLSATDGAWLEVGQSGTWPPSTHALARWNESTSGRKLQTRPSLVAATALLGTLVNNTGHAVSQMDVFYDLGSWLPEENEQVFGHRVFYSLTGEPGSWQVIPSLSSTAATSTAGETRLQATLALGSWPPGAIVYLLWLDDNGLGGSENSGTGQEGAYTMDNFGVTGLVPTSSP